MKNYTRFKIHNIKAKIHEWIDIHFRPKHYIKKCQQIDFIHEYDYGNCHCKECKKMNNTK
jgi:hypothetical protein